jgi:hypothetical protein
MPPDADRPAFPEPPPAAKPTPSAADNVRNALLGIGSIGLELASLGAEPSPYGNDVRDDPIGESKRAKTWYGTILQWAWAVLICLVGVAALILAIGLAIVWVMSWFI